MLCAGVLSAHTSAPDFLLQFCTSLCLIQWYETKNIASLGIDEIYCADSHINIVCVEHTALFGWWEASLRRTLQYKLH